MANKELRKILEKHVGIIENITWIECDGRDVLAAMDEIAKITEIECKKAAAR